MRDFTRQESAALDRHLTTDPRDRPTRRRREVTAPREPDPCPRCEWIGCHEEGCPNRSFPLDELLPLSKADLVARVRARGNIVSPIEKWSRDELIEELR